MRQDHPSIFLLTDNLIEVEPTQRQPLPFCRAHHSRDFHEEPFTPNTAFKIGCAGLRFRQEGDVDPSANKQGSQFQFGEGGFPHPVIIVCETPDQSTEA
jgi:hypothetical protein